MAITNLQIIDLRSIAPKVTQIRGNQVTEVHESQTRIESIDETAWLAAFNSYILGDFNASRQPVSIILPNRFVLFKTIKIPFISDSKRVESILRHEINEVFPHESEELMWNYCLIIKDDIEAVYLVGGIRVSLFRKIEGVLASRKIKLEALYPSLSIELQQLHDIESFQPDVLCHSVFMESNHAMVVTQQGMDVRVRTIRIDLAEEDGGAEMRRLGATLRRSSPGSTLARCAVVTLEGESSGALMAAVSDCLRVDQNDLIQLQSTAKSTAELLITRSEMNETTGLSRLRFSGTSDASHAGVSEKQKMIRMGLAGLLVALAPFMIFSGNQMKASAFRAELRSLQKEIQTEKRLADAARSSMEALDEAQDRSAIFVRESAMNPAIVALMSDLQLVLAEVEDIWVDYLEIVANDKGPAALSLSGRFLVKKANLDESERIGVIQNTQSRLNLFRAKLTETKLVGAFEDFTVNYEGVSQGVNIVPFSLSAPLAYPFINDIREDTDE
jgi:hypothetical protein